MSGNDRPIGIFDSGIGGLTVVRAIAGYLPAEDLVYLGDTARVPYGIKSASTIIRYSVQNARFLMERNLKLLVVACNSASSVALDVLQDQVSVPVLGVIEPGAVRAVETTVTGNVAVIGTAATIASGAYEKAIVSIDPSVRVLSRPCPLFVPLVEEGWVDNEICRLTVRSYLGDLTDRGVDTLVLGCTHYPLLKQAIANEVGPEIRLIDSAESVALEAGKLLDRNGMRRPGSDGEGRRSYFVTDMSDSFRRVGEHCLGDAIHDLNLVDIIGG